MIPGFTSIQGQELRRRATDSPLERTGRKT